MIGWAAMALAAEPVALVELFTSQGCSSCPPADSLMTEIAREARRDERPVYVLSFHVDYWDRLGWKDPYSDARWTGRQREYARAFGSERVYTPQVVVNGTREGVGSKAPLVKGLIAGALTRPAAAEVNGQATIVETGGKKAVRVEVTAVGAPIGGMIYVAVVEPERRNAIPKGENRGRNGVHSNVVRAMVKTDAPGSSGVLNLPDGLDLGTAEVVAWVSDPLTFEVVGASRLPLGR